MKTVALTIVLPVIFLLHLSNNVLIIWKKDLHKPRYFILMNLSFSDVLLLLTHFIRLNYLSHSALFLISDTTFYTASILSTLGITIDRYIAVMYCMKYNEYVTKPRICFALSLLWIFSAFLASIPTMAGSTHEMTSLYRDCVHVPLYLACCIFFVGSSIYIWYVRNKHVAEITKRNVYFGFIAERLGILQNLAKSVVDIIKLNVLTAFLVILIQVLKVVNYYWLDEREHVIFIILTLARAMYIMSNPVIYMLTMTELREQYKRIFKCNSVHPTSIDP